MWRRCERGYAEWIRKFYWPAVMAVMVIVVIVAVTVHRLLLQSLGVVHHPQHRGDVFSGGVQNFVHPLLPLAAVVDEYIRPTYPDHIRRGGLKAVGLPSGGHQQPGLHPLPADHPHEVVVGKQRADHREPAAVCSISFRGAGAQAQGRGRRQQQGQNAFSHFSASRHFSHRP